MIADDDLLLHNHHLSHFGMITTPILLGKYRSARELRQLVIETVTVTILFHSRLQTNEEN